jgi:hypothetical protein
MRSVILIVLVFSFVFEVKSQNQATHKLVSCDISGCHRKHQKTILVCDSSSGLTIKTILITSGSSYDMNGFAPLRKRSKQYVYAANAKLLLKGISKYRQRGDATITRKSNYISFDHNHSGFTVFHRSFFTGNKYLLKYDASGKRISKTHF